VLSHLPMSSKKPFSEVFGDQNPEGFLCFAHSSPSPMHFLKFQYISTEWRNILTLSEMNAAILLKSFHSVLSGCDAKDFTGTIFTP
jgi:hypothetical protein